MRARVVRRTERSAVFQSGSFLLARRKQEIFPSRFSWESGQAPGGKPHRVAGGPNNWVPLEFLTVRVVHTGPPALYPLQVWSSSPGPGAHGGAQS